MSKHRMNKRRSRVAAAASLAMLTFVAPRSNANIQEFLDSVGAQYNVTPAGVYQGSTMNVATGGGFVYRAPNKSFTPFTITPPSLKAGCGGIDFFTGSIGIPSKAEFVNFIRSIGTAMPGLAFQLALQSLSPDFEKQLTSFRNYMRQITDNTISSCETANLLLKGSPIGEGIKAAGQSAGNWMRDTLQSTDAASAKNDSKADWSKAYKWFGSQPTEQREGVAADGTTSGVARQGPQVNVIWSILNSAKTSSTYSTEDKELIMSLFNFVIYRNADNTDPENNPDNRPVPDYRQRKVRLLDVLGQISETAGTTTSVPMWQCDDSAKCLSPTVPGGGVAVLGFAQRVYDAARRVQNSILTRTMGYTAADMHLVANSSSVPLLKLINASTFQRYAGFSGDFLRTYAELAAFDLTAEYLFEVTNLLEARIKSARHDNTAMPSPEDYELLGKEVADRRLEIAEARRTIAAKVQSMGEIIRIIEHVENASRGTLSSDLRANLDFASSRRR
jgi:conjugative transfer pilus assembly protein TraH